MEMKLGTEDKKKTAAAVALTAVALITVYVQFFSGGGSTTRPRPVPPRPAASAPVAAPGPATASATPAGSTERRAVRRTAPRSTTRRRNQSGDFEPIWRRSHEDEAFDPLADDPSLQTALLDAVRAVGFSGIDRNIFEFTARRKKVAPPPPDLVAKAQAQQDAFAKRAEEAKTAPAKPAERRAPRLTWKYYGFAGEAGSSARRAFLLDGEDVLIAGENDTLKGGRYRIVRIGLTSIVIEDTEFKQEQSLALTAPRS